MDPNTIISELREFYGSAEGGIFAKCLPDFEHALAETLRANGIP